MTTRKTRVVHMRPSSITSLGCKYDTLGDVFRACCQPSAEDLLSDSAYIHIGGVNEVPAGFPAVALWDFRIASLGIQTVLWGSIGVLFGYVGPRKPALMR